MKVFDESSNEIEYQQFKTLYDTLYSRRTIQGYGEFFRIQPDDSIDESFAAIFESLVEDLRKIEAPLKTSNWVDDVFDDMCGDVPAWTYISRKTIHNLPEEDIAAFKNAPGSQERLVEALERLKVKKEQSRQERQARIAQEIQHRYAERISQAFKSTALRICPACFFDTYSKSVNWCPKCWRKGDKVKMIVESRGAV